MLGNDINLFYILLWQIMLASISSCLWPSVCRLRVDSSLSQWPRRCNLKDEVPRYQGPWRPWTSVYGTKDNMLNVFRVPSGVFQLFFGFRIVWEPHVIHAACPGFETTRGRFNIKTVFTGMDSRYKDKTGVNPSYLYNWNPYTGNTFLYWIVPLERISNWNVNKICLSPTSIPVVQSFWIFALSTAVTLPSSV